VNDSESDFIVECASHCRNCTDCHQPFPCGACLAGGICDAWCDCDRLNDERYEDGHDGDDT